ncbi:hypothetical protein [Halobaculum rarum]|uniref:hypothetical protein n=1 Tax=Halobaculum rarum TaxID=3075122 RepID=UPI0032AF57B7
MQRRQYIGAVSSVISTVAVAGCTGGSTGDGTNTGITRSTSTSSEEQKAAEHMELAGKALQRAGEEISTQSEKFKDSEVESGSGLDFEPETIYDYLDTASEELDQAEKHASAPQQEKISAARGYISFARKMAEFLDVFAEAYTQTTSGFSYFRSERYSEAAEQLETAESTLSESDDILTVVQDRQEQLDTELLDEVSEVEVESIKTELTAVDEVLPALSALASGIRQLSLGLVDFEEATTQIENDQYADAESSYDRSVDHFTTSETTFKDRENTVPDSMKTTFIELTCYGGALKDGARHLREACAALNNGNDSRASTETEKAKEALDRCNFDN